MTESVRVDVVVKYVLIACCQNLIASPIEEYLILVNTSRLEKADLKQFDFRDLLNLFQDIKLNLLSGDAIVQVESEPS